MGKLKNSGLFWGATLTMTKTNFDEVTDDAFIKQLVDSGCKFFMLVEYTPVTAGTENWVLSEEQKAKSCANPQCLPQKILCAFYCVAVG